MEQINEKIVSTSVTQGAEMSLHRLIPNIEFAPSLHGVVYMGKGSCTVDGITCTLYSPPSLGPIFVLQATKAGRGGLGARLQSTYLIIVQFLRV